MMTTYERRQEMVEMIRREEGVSSSKLAEMTGVSLRTIRRDIDAISLYAPIYCHTGRSGGVFIIPDKKSMK